MSSPPNVARKLFAPIAPSYERWAAVLSLGQDARWRRAMIDVMDLAPGATVLDLAAGTGSITRLLEDDGHSVIALDQSLQMLSRLRARGERRILATAATLPIDDEAVDAVTFGYLLRYVNDVAATMREVARVVKPGGRVGMVEFGRPHGIWGPPWWFHTRIGLPVAGSLIGGGWREVGNFLGPSIDRFWAHQSPSGLAEIWRDAGLAAVMWRSLSLGGGLVMVGTRS